MASLSVLFKHKSVSFVNLSLFLHSVSIFWLERLYILPKPQRPALKVHVLWCKAGIYSWNLSIKYPWYTKIHFQFQFIAIWSISTSTLSTTAWKAPASSLFPSELVMFLKIAGFWITGVLGRSVNFKIPNGFVCRRPVFPDYLSISCDCF